MGFNSRMMLEIMQVGVSLIFSSDVLGMFALIPPINNRQSSEKSSESPRTSYTYAYAWVHSVRMDVDLLIQPSQRQVPLITRSSIPGWPTKCFGTILKYFRISKPIPTCSDRASLCHLPFSRLNPNIHFLLFTFSSRLHSLTRSFQTLYQRVFSSGLVQCASNLYRIRGRTLSIVLDTLTRRRSREQSTLLTWKAQ